MGCANAQFGHALGASASQDAGLGCGWRLEDAGKLFELTIWYSSISG